METTHIILGPAYHIAAVDPRIFGGFLEHMGRAVYEGVFDLSSAHVDENGFYKDVLGASVYDEYLLLYLQVFQKS